MSDNITAGVMPENTPAVTVEPKTQGGLSDAELKAYSAEYVRQLNAESAERRVKNKELTERVETMTTELEQAKARAAELEAVAATAKEKEAELQALSAKIADLEGYRERWVKMEETERESILSKLPEDKREVYKTLPLDALKVINQDFLSTPIGSKAAGRGTPPGNQTQDLRKLTSEDLAALRVSNPDMYREALREMMRKK
jgi:hypothetical protein